FLSVLFFTSSCSLARFINTLNYVFFCYSNLPCLLDEVKSKASAHRPARLPAGFSGQRYCVNLKTDS
ncbi:MAG: hypothetical protein ACFB0B_19235, partial [Thermonemataceae bacterium]